MQWHAPKSTVCPAKRRATGPGPQLLQLADPACLLPPLLVRDLPPGLPCVGFPPGPACPPPRPLGAAFSGVRGWSKGFPEDPTSLFRRLSITFPVFAAGVPEVGMSVDTRKREIAAFSIWTALMEDGMGRGSHHHPTPTLTPTPAPHQEQRQAGSFQCARALSGAPGAKIAPFSKQAHWNRNKNKKSAFLDILGGPTSFCQLGPGISPSAQTPPQSQ